MASALDDSGRTPPAVPAAGPTPATGAAPSGSAVDDALNWRPSSRIGRLAVIPVSLIPGPPLLRAYQLSAGIAIFVANVVGMAIVIALTLWVIPGTPVPGGDATIINAAVLSSYVLVAFLVGGIVIFRQSSLAWRWLRERREPTPQEELAVLRAPLRVLAVLVAFWFIATILATSINLWFSWRLGLRVAITATLGGLTTSAFGYLLTERVMRPAARVVLSHRSGRAPPALPGASIRQLFTWLLGTGSAVFGVWIVGLLYLAGGNPSSAKQLAITMVALSSITLTAGLFAEFVVSRAVADPIKGLRHAISRITDGDLTARVVIEDATEVGQLQAGFNQMAAGLEEREALRDLFGRHVGDEVAATALERGLEMGGETRHVAAMFVDVVGSTSMAMERPATEVVTAINRFFELVIATTSKHGGHVNKFAGDGALIVFGAPIDLPDAPTRALRAARELAALLEAEAPETPATIGVSGGDVIAGNMGTTERFEYTVMGDPVNEAARLGSQAKALPHRVAAAGRLLQEASDEERAHWEIAYSVVLRGRSARTDVARIRAVG